MSGTIICIALPIKRKNIPFVEFCQEDYQVDALMTPQPQATYTMACLNKRGLS